MWMISNITQARHASLSHETIPHHEGMCLSNHVKFRCIQAQVEGISGLAPFTAQHVMSIDNEIGDGIVGRLSMTFQESFDKDSIDGNGK